MKRQRETILFVFLTLAAILIAAQPASAQPVPPDGVTCLAPCQFDPTSGDVYCPCSDANQPTVPEPMSLALLGTGLLGTAALRKNAANR